MNAFSRGLGLFKQSSAVLRQNRSLIWLPIISVSSLLLLLAAIITSTYFTYGATRSAALWNAYPSITIFVGFTVLFFILTTISTFFDVALLFAVNELFDGRSTTLKESLAFAWSRRGKVATWSAFSVAATMISNQIESKVGWLGKLGFLALGIAWSLVSFIILPVFILEGVGIKEAVQRGYGYFKRTWGTNVYGNVRVGVFLLVIAIAAYFIGAALSTATGAFLFFVVHLSDATAGMYAISFQVLLVLFLIGLGFYGTVLTRIFQVALYRYASRGEITSYYSSEFLEEAYIERKGILRKR